MVMKRTISFLCLFFAAPFVIFAQGVASPEIGAGTYDETGYVRNAEYNNLGLVPCDGTECNQCHLVRLADNVIGWLIMFLTVVAVIALVIAGFKLVTSGGNPSALQAAKETLINILIGFILVLAAWLIVDTLLKAATGQGLEKWGQVECGTQVQPGGSPS